MRSLRGVRVGLVQADAGGRGVLDLSHRPLLSGGLRRGRRSTLGPRWVNRGSPIFGGHPWVPAEN